MGSSDSTIDDGDGSGPPQTVSACQCEVAPMSIPKMFSSESDIFSLHEYKQAFVLSNREALNPKHGR